MNNVWCNRCCSGYAKRITYSEFAFVALGIKNVTLKRHIVVYVLPRSTIFFPTLSHKQHDFRRGGGNLLNTKCVF